MASFWDRLWGKSIDPKELLKQWNDARYHQDPSKKLAGLRKLQHYFLAHAAELPSWYPQFMQDILQCRDLTEQDWIDAELIGYVLKGCKDALYKPEDIWYRVFEALDRQGQRQKATVLLRRIHDDSTTSQTMKQRCMRELALREKREQLPGLPAQPIQPPASPSAPPEPSTPLVTPQETQKQQPLPAPATKPGHKSSWEPSKKPQLDELLHLLHQGAYDDIIDQVQSTKWPVSAQIRSLVLLCEALRWLESRDIAGPCPIGSSVLAKLLMEAGRDSIEAGRDTMEGRFYSQIEIIAVIALGRLYLIEGDAAQAWTWLQRIRFRSHDQSRGYYYLAWAGALAGRYKEVATCLSDIEAWNGRWTIACLLLEVDPEEGRPRGLLSLSAQAQFAVPEAYASVFQFRVALVWSTLPEPVQWTPRTGTLEEDLEGLRSTLGYVFYIKDAPEMRRALALPLFQRLPLADQITWQGLYAVLTGDESQAYLLLERAAGDLGARRAASILSVLYLEQGQMVKARGMLQVATLNPAEFKRQLLLAHFQLYDGNIAQARQILEKIAKRGKAQYALGNSYLFQAEEAMRNGLVEQAHNYYEQATQAFAKSMVRQDVALPAASSRRATYAKTMAVADRQQLAQLQQEQSIHLFSGEVRQMQESWTESLILLGTGTPALAATACEDLLELLPHAPPIDGSALETIARAAAYQCSRAERPEQAEKMIDLLNYLATKSQLASVKDLHQQSLVTVAHLRYQRAGGQQREEAYRRLIEQLPRETDNFALVILSAYTCVQRQQPEQAVALLQAAKPALLFERDVQACLMYLFSRPQLASDRLPRLRMKENIPVALTQACRILHAATAFATQHLDQGYESVLAASQPEGDSVLSVIDQRRLITSLCTYMPQGKPLPPLLDAALRLSPHLRDSEIALKLARYLTSLGEADHASAWWERVLTLSSVEDALRQEAIGFLCHRAVQDQQAGNYDKALAKLRLATRFLRGGRHA